jgi:hypothetical protein
MDSVEEYARLSTKYEGQELDALSEWIKSIQKLLKSRIHHLSGIWIPGLPTICWHSYGH